MARIYEAAPGEPPEAHLREDRRGRARVGPAPLGAQEEPPRTGLPTAKGAAPGDADVRPARPPPGADAAPAAAGAADDVQFVV